LEDFFLQRDCTPR